LFIKLQKYWSFVIYYSSHGTLNGYWNISDKKIEAIPVWKWLLNS